jgi:hypothetical protein
MESKSHQLREALRELTPDQRFDVAWADEGEEIHGVVVTAKAKAVAYWMDCDT